MTETFPHIVYPKQLIYGVVRLFPTFRDAHAFWKSTHSHTTPYVIATVGRVIDPSTPVIDVNE